MATAIANTKTTGSGWPRRNSGSLVEQQAKLNVNPNQSMTLNRTINL
jgi:hypothetical protein